MSKSDSTIPKVIDSLGETDNVIRLSTGVELYVKQANPNILIRVMTATKRPDPPTYFDKAMGREMENYDHPEYIKSVQSWEMDYNSAMLNALVGLGTELKNKPKGMPGPDDDAWVKDYKAFGLPVIPDSKAWRYQSWVLFIAAPTDRDMKLIGDAVKKLSGVREEDVQDAESFPGSDKAGR